MKVAVLFATLCTVLDAALAFNQPLGRRGIAPLRIAERAEPAERASANVAASANAGVNSKSSQYTFTSSPPNYSSIIASLKSELSSRRRTASHSFTLAPGPAIVTTHATATVGETRTTHTHIGFTKTLTTHVPAPMSRRRTSTSHVTSTKAVSVVTKSYVVTEYVTAQVTVDFTTTVTRPPKTVTVTLPEIPHSSHSTRKTLAVAGGGSAGATGSAAVS